jgi:hypothetical protein
MSPLATSLIVLVCIFGSAVVGLLLRTCFPDGHLSAETKEVVKLVIGIVGTMTGMVLGLLVASAKSSFDSQRGGVAQLAANVIVLDRALAHYGTETRETRDVLRNSVDEMIQKIWPDEAPPPPSSSKVGDNVNYEEVYDRILALEPKNDSQRTTQSQALKVIHDTAEKRWLLYSERSSSIPPVFLVLMVAWLAVTFASYGLFAPRHTTAMAVLLLGSLVVSSAVFLILELDHPFGGIMHISSQPLRNALLQIGR